MFPLMKMMKDTIIPMDFVKSIVEIVEVVQCKAIVMKMLLKNGIAGSSDKHDSN